MKGRKKKVDLKFLTSSLSSASSFSLFLLFSLLRIFTHFLILPSDHYLMAVIYGENALPAFMENSTNLYYHPPFRNFTVALSNSPRKRISFSLFFFCPFQQSILILPNKKKKKG